MQAAYDGSIHRALGIGLLMPRRSFARHPLVETQAATAPRNREEQAAERVDLDSEKPGHLLPPIRERRAQAIMRATARQTIHNAAGEVLGPIMMASLEWVPGQWGGGLSGHSLGGLGRMLAAAN